jgi:2-keto-4-pentenoate hydratase/2-oxohepta-3-ene-1,7-dioic acid hydratase in catechol pathway
MTTDHPDRTVVARPSAPRSDAYGAFTPPHEREIPTAALAADYARLAEITAENPDVSYHVRYDHDGRVAYGILRGDVVHELDAHFFAHPARTGRTAPLDAVRLLAPLDPNRVSKVLGVAANTSGGDPASVPSGAHPGWFAKLPTSITGPGGGFEVPEEATNYIHEAELVVVIGREGRHLSVEEAADHIWGVTVGNDLTELGWFTSAWDRGRPSPILGKISDAMAPIGPAIAVGLDYRDLATTHHVNGVLTQRGSTADRLQHPAEVVSHVSRWVTLLPGDVIFTGATPFEPGANKKVGPGDEVVAEIDRLGILRNRAIAMGGVRWEDRRRPAGSRAT